MSLYNLIHGVNPMAGVLMSALGLNPTQVPRFRDCYWNGKHIVVYTRTGGGNRDDYESEIDRLRAVAGFERDEDDDFDCTYASFYFTPAPDLSEAFSRLSAEDATPEQKWTRFFDDLKRPDATPQVARVLEHMKPIMDAIATKGEGT